MGEKKRREEMRVDERGGEWGTEVRRGDVMWVEWLTINATPWKTQK